MRIENICANNIEANTNAPKASYNASVNGKNWSNITTSSRYWQPLQAAIAGGAVVRPCTETAKDEFII